MLTQYRFSGKRVRAERKRRGLSLEELASMIGVSAPFLGQIELGKRKPSLETFERLLAVFKESPESLMEADHGDAGVSHEKRLASLLQGQPKERQELILDSLKFFIKRLSKEPRRAR